MKATVGEDGLAVVPIMAPPVVQQVIIAGNKIAKMPYIYGGGHGKWEDAGYDCSGSVSYALHGAGLLETAMPSGSFMNWGDPGPGQWITLYATRRTHLHDGRRPALRHERALERRHALAGRHALRERLHRPPPARLVAPRVGSMRYLAEGYARA